MIVEQVFTDQGCRELYIVSVDNGGQYTAACTLSEMIGFDTDVRNSVGWISCDNDWDGLGAYQDLP